MSGIYYRSLPLSVLGNLARVTITHTQRNGNATVLDSILFKTLEERYGRFDSALLRENSTKMGPKIREMDALRTDTYRGIINILNGYKILGGDEEAKAATTLLQMMKSKKPVVRLGLSEKSEILLKFIKDFSLAENQSLIAELRLTEYFDRLRDAQISFDNLVREKQNALSELRQMEWASKIRPELEEALRNYFAFIDMMQNNPDFRDLHFDLEQARITANGARRPRRSKKSSTEQPKTEAPETATPTTKQPEAETPKAEEPNTSQPDTPTTITPTTEASAGDEEAAAATFPVEYFDSGGGLVDSEELVDSEGLVESGGERGD